MGMYFGNYTYALISPGADVTKLQTAISGVLNEKAGHGPSVSSKLFLQSLKDIHLHSHLESEIEPNTRPVVLYILSTIGVLIILIACINFMNLATARSGRRAKEVGMRKVLGAAKPQLLRQFLGESICLSAVALFLSLGLVEIFLPGFNSLVDQSLTFEYNENLLLLAALMGLSMVVGVLAGTYPALVLASFKPIDSLRGAMSVGRSAKSQVFLRKGLVVTQFAISVFLISGTLIINRQLDYFRNAKLGFDSDLTVVIPMDDDSMTDKYDLIKEELLNYPQVRAVTASYKAPIGENGFDTSLYPNGRDGDERVSINMNFVDYNFLDAFGLQLVAGRNFSPEFKTDEQNAFIVNEAALRKLGFVDAEEALGKRYLIGINRIQGTIVGVTKDFHINSLHEEIQPLVMMYWPRLYGALSVRLSSDNIPGALQLLESTWGKFIPDFPFRYEFLDDYIDTLYQSEEISQKIIGTFSGLAIFIACLGLLGLASFTAEQRTKEIGVRKVLGASVPGIIALLNKDFLKLVFVASVIAWPAVWFTMNRWLHEFAYRIDISWTTMVLSTGIVLLVALLTVSYQAVKAGLINPVEALRSE